MPSYLAFKIIKPSYYEWSLDYHHFPKVPFRKNWNSMVNKESKEIQAPGLLWQSIFAEQCSNSHVQSNFIWTSIRGLHRRLIDNEINSWVANNHGFYYYLLCFSGYPGIINCIFTGCGLSYPQTINSGLPALWSHKNKNRPKKSANIFNYQTVQLMLSRFMATEINWTDSYIPDESSVASYD